VTFIIDAQLPPRLARWFQKREHKALHTSELQRGNRTPDRDLLTLAHSEKDAVLITKDNDFQMSFETGNIHNDDLIALFERHETTLIELLLRYSFLELRANELIVHR
jgi:predicted nuclease of predicted toxin-antitoxin system